MRVAIHPLPQYVFMAWCLVKYRKTLPFTFTSYLNKVSLIKLNVLCKSLYRTGSLRTVARELAKYNLDLVTIQGLRWKWEC
jgi:hypothetical protein